MGEIERQLERARAERDGQEARRSPAGSGAPPARAILIFTTGAEPIDVGGAFDIEAQCWSAGIVFPAKQVIVRAFGFIGTPAARSQFGLTGLSVGGEQQMLIASPVPFQALTGPESLILPTAKVGEPITMRVVNLGDAPAPFTALMDAVIDDPIVSIDYARAGDPG